MQAVTVDHGKPHCNTVLCIGTSVLSLYLRIYTGEGERQECVCQGLKQVRSRSLHKALQPHTHLGTTSAAHCERSEALLCSRSLQQRTVKKCWPLYTFRIPIRMYL